MLNLIIVVILRIVSNSYLNVYQKFLTSNGVKSSVVNFYTYLGLSILGLCFLNYNLISVELLRNAVIMGLLGAIGNYYIIKALSLADLSSISPINSYKPIIALLFGIFYLKEIPTLTSLLGILLIIIGTYFLYFNRVHNCVNVSKMALIYRILALIFSGIEAIFIKKVILLSDIYTALILWAVFGFIFSIFFVISKPLKLNIKNIKFQILLIFFVFLMQFSTNYVFLRMNVAYSLALFQLSTILSVILGVKIFQEQSLKQKLIGSFIMLIGAIIIILN